ncbi:hypothetical protein GKIL_2381 [Gloeobacter kilaueensis JS1]|uniref:Tetratricopeptide repeat protein n=2 Tax=Gloeobacter TaxID=33071 RepID=U5QI20_GLOK1|nr:hypothetical protein GKIL_2381 [Gloeobacter kilaueensis JS1]
MVSRMFRRAFLRSGATSVLFTSVSAWGLVATEAKGKTGARFAEAVLVPTFLLNSEALGIAPMTAWSKLLSRQLDQGKILFSQTPDADRSFRRAANRLTLLGSQSSKRSAVKKTSWQEEKKETDRILRAALDEYTTGLQLDPTAIQARTERALVYWQLQQIDEALIDCDIVLDSPGDNFTLRAMRILGRLQSGDPAGATTDCGWVLEHPPTDPSDAMLLPLVLAARGEAQHALGQEEQAIIDYTAALNFPGAQEGPAYTVRFSRGCAYYALGKYQQASEDFSAMSQSQPEIAFYDRGLCYVKLNRLQEALRDFDLAIRWDSDLQHAEGDHYIGRGLTWQLLGDETKARQDYLYALALYKADLARYGDENKGRPRLRLALAYATLGERETARQTLLLAKAEADSKQDIPLLRSINKYLQLLSK